VGSLPHAPSVFRTTPKDRRRLVAAAIAEGARGAAGLRCVGRSQPFLRRITPTSTPRTLPGATRRSWPTIALSHAAFSRAAAAAARWCGCSIPRSGGRLSSPHTVIEMVNDDMPFLVDSIGLALSSAPDAAFSGASRSSPVTRDGAGNCVG
jgi:glutamate dehydrogenase